MFVCVCVCVCVCMPLYVCVFVCVCVCVENFQKGEGLDRISIFRGGLRGKKR